MLARRWMWPLPVVLLLCTALLVRAQEPDARDLVKRVADALPKVSFVSTLKLTTPQGMRELRLSHKLVGGARASFLEVTAPADLAGMRFLFLEHADKPPEQYVKIPAARRGVLVSDSARAQPFLGSSFAVADLVEPDLDAFTYRFVGETTVLGRPCKLVESVPKKPEGALYGKTINALDPHDLLVLRREFFDEKNRALKVWEVAKVERIDGNWTIKDQTMTTAKERATSRLEVETIAFDVELPDTMFTPESLLR
jgi:negative regulator of sigma E activity